MTSPSERRDGRDGPIARARTASSGLVPLLSRLEPQNPQKPGLALSFVLDDETLAALAELVAPIVAERVAQPVEAPASPYLTIRETADYLRTNRQRVDDLLSRGRLTRVKDGARTLIERAELEHYLANGGR